VPKHNRRNGSKNALKAMQELSAAGRTGDAAGLTTNGCRIVHRQHDVRALTAERLGRSDQSMRDARTPPSWGAGSRPLSDTIEILKQRICDQIKASDERCIACQELVRQATEGVPAAVRWRSAQFNE
jgi:hypothetical protein